MACWACFAAVGVAQRTLRRGTQHPFPNGPFPIVHRHVGKVDGDLGVGMTEFVACQEVFHANTASLGAVSSSLQLR